MSNVVSGTLMQIKCPDELRDLKAWVTWNYEQTPEEKAQGKKPRKVPYYASGQRRYGVQGTAEDRGRLVTAGQAKLAAIKAGHEGIGFVPQPEMGITIIDFDNAILEDGEMHPDVVAAAGMTYCEVSPSGHGIHAFFRGSFPNKKSHANAQRFGVEVFCSSGFVTFTGKATGVCEMLGLENTIAPLSEAMLQMLSERFLQDLSGPRPARAGDPIGYSDEQLQEMLSAIDPGDDDYHAWISVGMALHHETDGDGRGFELWDEWSSRGIKYEGREKQQEKWESFGRSTAVPVTIRSLVKQAKAAGVDVGNAVATADEFEALEDEGEEEGVGRLPLFDRQENGKIRTHINNLVTACASQVACGVAIAYDTFRDVLMYGPGGRDGWEPFTDVVYTRLQMRLERLGFNKIPREMMRDAVEEVARRSSFDSGIIWLEQIVPAWDGVKRIDSFLVDYWSTEDNAYVRAVSLYLWTALAGRCLEPGVKADMVPIFTGPQGCGKSTGVARLAPTEEVFCEIAFGEKEDDLARRLRGRLVAELGELRGLHTRELEHIKAWVTRRFESWVPKFKEFAASYPRRCVFVGTTNEDLFLADATGNRRWLPVKVGQVSDFSDVLVQLWAEARDRFKAEGIQFKDAERLAVGVHEEHMMVDPRAEAIQRWLETEDELGGGSPGQREWLTTLEVGEAALGLKQGRGFGRTEEAAIGKILLGLGYQRTRRRLGEGGSRLYVYVKGAPGA